MNLFHCRSCGRDTLTRPHAINCPEQTRREFRTQPVFKPDELQLPLRLNPG